MKRTNAERAAMNRDDNSCRRCGRYLSYGVPYSVHHRLPRSAGTQAQVDTLANLVLVCGTGTSPHCHAWIHQHPAESYASGWLIRRSESDPPESISLIDAHDWEFFLTDDGGVIYIRTGQPA